MVRIPSHVRIQLFEIESIIYECQSTNDYCFSGLYGNLNMYGNNPYAYSGYPYGHLGAYGLRQGYYPYAQTAGAIAL